MTGIRTFASRWRGRPEGSILLMVLSMKLLLLVYGVLSYRMLLPRRWWQLIASRSIQAPRSLLETYNRLDAPHYLDIAKHGYVTAGQERLYIVFYPLFPWLVRAVSWIVGSVLVSGYIVAGIASIFAALVLYRLVLLDDEPSTAWRAVWFLLIFPTSYVLHIPYTESLFLALMLGSFLMARTDRWMLAGVLGALAAFTRVNGLLLAPALAVEVLHQWRSSGRWQWQRLWAALVPAGTLAYLFVNYYVHGNPLQFLVYDRQYWHKSLSWPWVGIGKLLAASSPRNGLSMILVPEQELLFLAVGLAVVVYAAVKLRPSYAVWSGANWLLMMTTTLIQSTPRYTMLLFPVYVLMARAGARPTAYALLTAGSLLLLTLLLGQFVRTVGGF